ncbi:MAG: hypothetical protein FWG13_01240 [Leptospirales bacterium]|nr:hypothetical protein [Leptospirales bacterium]
MNQTNYAAAARKPKQVPGAINSVYAKYCACQLHEYLGLDKTGGIRLSYYKKFIVTYVKKSQAYKEYGYGKKQIDMSVQS